MGEEIDNWLKDADGVVIECEEDEITPHSLVSVTPMYLEGKEGSASGQRTILLKEAFKIKKKQIVRGRKLIEYLNSRIGKEPFD